MKKPRQVEFLRHGEQKLLSTLSIYAPSPSKTHKHSQDLMNPYHGMHPTNLHNDEHNFRIQILNPERKKKLNLRFQTNIET